jgi:hypothetical protein
MSQAVEEQFVEFLKALCAREAQRAEEHISAGQWNATIPPSWAQDSRDVSASLRSLSVICNTWLCDIP